jgi:hypothetical protein
VKKLPLRRQFGRGTLVRALGFIDGSDRGSNGMRDPALRQVQQHLAEFGDGYAYSFLAAVPEPRSLGVLGLGGLAIATRRRRRSRI